MERNEVYRIVGGVFVLAKLDRGETVPYTFANETQARKRAEALVGEGINASVYRKPTRRPFYVRIDPDTDGNFPWETPAEAFERGVSEGMAAHAAALVASRS